MSVLKMVSGISFMSAFAAFEFAPTSSWAESGQRALIVFAFIFLWSWLFLYLLTRILPAGQSLFASAGPRPEGSGEEKFVDLEKQPLDRSKLQDLLR